VSAIKKVKKKFFIEKILNQLLKLQKSEKFLKSHFLYVFALPLGYSGKLCPLSKKVKKFFYLVFTEKISFLFL
jgi:hypothetical protein